MSIEQQALENIESICGSFLFDDYPLSSWGNYETYKDRIVAEFKLDDDFITLKQALEDLELYKKAFYNITKDNTKGIFSASQLRDKYLNKAKKELNK